MFSYSMWPTTSMHPMCPLCPLVIWKTVPTQLMFNVSTWMSTSKSNPGRICLEKNRAKNQVWMILDDVERWWMIKTKPTWGRLIHQPLESSSVRTHRTRQTFCVPSGVFRWGSQQSGQQNPEDTEHAVLSSEARKAPPWVPEIRFFTQVQELEIHKECISYYIKREKTVQFPWISMEQLSALHQQGCKTQQVWTLSTAHVQLSYASLHHCIHFAHEFSDPRFFRYFVDL